MTVLAGVTGCSSCGGERSGPPAGQRMEEGKVLRALERAEATGTLQSGQEIEHYVSGGQPPPYYRSEQLRLIVREGRAVFWFVTPDFTAEVRQGESYPRHVYVLAATPEQVRTVARLVRESGAFDAATSVAPAGEAPVADVVRTELTVSLDGNKVERVYPGAEPPELARLRVVITPLIAQLRARGDHRVDR